MSSTAQAHYLNTLLNNVGSKHSLVTKFSQFMQYYQIIFLSYNSTKNVACKLVPGPFYFSKNPPSNGIKEGLCAYWGKS